MTVIRLLTLLGTDSKTIFMSWVKKRRCSRVFLNLKFARPTLDQYPSVAGPEYKLLETFTILLLPPPRAGTCDG